MIITKLPSGDYYIKKSRNGGFIFFTRAKPRTSRGIVFLATYGIATIPPELIGKKLMFKVEVLDDKKAQNR